MLPDFTSQTLPDTFGLMRGAFFDSAPIHVLASTSLEHLKRLCGDDSILDPRRFRPNIFLDTGGTGADGFVEDEWLEGTLEVGETVKIIETEAGAALRDDDACAIRPAPRPVDPAHCGAAS